MQVTGAIKSAKARQNIPTHEIVRCLQGDIRNGPSHVFGDHSKCKEDFCSGEKPGELNVVEDLKNFGLRDHMLANLAYYTYSLLQCVTTNLVESYNSVVCKLISGKRLYFIQRSS